MKVYRYNRRELSASGGYLRFGGNNIPAESVAAKAPASSGQGF